MILFLFFLYIILAPNSRIRTGEDIHRPKTVCTNPVIQILGAFSPKYVSCFIKWLKEFTFIISLQNSSFKSVKAPLNDVMYTHRSWTNIDGGLFERWTLNPEGMGVYNTQGKHFIMRSFGYTTNIISVTKLTRMKWRGMHHTYDRT
jgi:hypothetical protein